MSHPVNGVEYRNKQWLISVENSGQSQLLSQAQSTGTNLGNNLGANFDKNAAIDDQKKQQNAGNEHLFCAKNLIMAVPPRQILNYLTPTQYLSPELIAALSSTPTWMSAQAKFVAVYQTAFWREQGLAGQVFSKTGPMVEIHDASASPMQGFALFGFIGVPLAMRKKIATEHLKTACIEQLVALFGPVARTPKVSYLTDWATDKYVATEKDLTELPRHAEFSMQRHQHELNSLNLYLSASEVSANEAGYLEGALGAADEVIKQLVRPEN
jgi:monoamine oxidase